MNGNTKIELPDLEAEGMKEIHACLKEFGLNEGEFTFAPAIGGVLVYDINTGFIWFPMIVMEALGASMIESQLTESIGNYAGNLGGVYGGRAVGGVAGGTVVAGVMLMFSRTLRMLIRRALGGAAGGAVRAAKGTATLLRFSGGFLAVSILGGAYLGGLIGKKAVRRLGFRDPPQELTPYPKQTIHHIEILAPSIYAKSLDSSKNAKNKIFSVITKESIEDRDSLVLCIVTRFKPQTGELNSLIDRTKSEAQEKEKSRRTLLKQASKLWRLSQGFLGNTTVGYFNLTRDVDAIRFRNSRVLEPLKNTINAQGIPLVEKYRVSS